jgi:hypothetical protein
LPHCEYLVCYYPLKYTDPSGHQVTQGCGDEGKGACGATAKEKAQTEYQRQRDGGLKCDGGNKTYCSYAENHPVATAAYTVGGLGLVAAGAAAVTATAFTGETIATVTTSACIDGDCTNELSGAGQAFQNAFETTKSVVDKLNRYLLNPDHPEGGSKAMWFERALGYTRNNSYALAKQIVFNADLASSEEITQYGTKFNQIIRITGANGRQIDVNFVWIKNFDGITRLVTAIPTSKR